MDDKLKEQFLDSLKLQLDGLTNERKFMEQCGDLLNDNDENFVASLTQAHEKRQLLLSDDIANSTVVLRRTSLHLWLFPA